MARKQSDVATTGRGGNANFPNARKSKADPAVVSLMLTDVLESYKQPKVKSDDELMQRIDGYFRDCANKGQYPTVEEMAMSTGYTLSTVWDWENGRNKGFSCNTSEVIKKAKDFIKTFDAKMAIAGQIDFVTYCFRAKNYYGMRDQTDLVITPNQPLGDGVAPEDVAQKYAELPED